MFDWDDVPEDLGGANRGTIEATARAARAEIEKNFEDLRQTELSAAQIEIHEPVQELGIHADMSIENRHPKAESTHSKTSWMDQLQGHASNEGNNIQKKADKPKAKKAVKKAAAVSKEVQLAEKSGANDLQGVLKLLQQGARTNATDPAGETPLFRAAAGGNIDIVLHFLSMELIRAGDPLLGGLQEMWLRMPQQRFCLICLVVYTLTIRKLKLPSMQWETTCALP